MTQDYDTLVPDARAFLNDLADNNSREWFMARKQIYESRLQQPARALLVDFASTWSLRIDQPLTPKLYRANRDMRAAAEQCPYHTRLSMQWSEPSGLTWHLGICPDGVRVGAGLAAFDRTRTEAWRRAIRGSAGARMTQTLTRAAARLDPPELKRVPPPDGPDHPHATLLRRKSLMLWQDIGLRVRQVGLPDAMDEAFERMCPAMDLLRAIVVLGQHSEH